MAEKSKPINYTAFEGSKAPKIGLYLIGAGTIVFLVLFTMLIPLADDPQYMDSVSKGSDALFSAGLCIAFALFFIGAFLYAWQYKRFHKQTFNRFVFDNDWQPMPSASDDDLSTSLLGLGRDEEFSDMFQGIYKDIPFTMLCYTVTSGNGRSSRTYNFLSLHFKLHKKFPLIVLDDTRNNYFKLVSDLPGRIPDGRALQLEGDFNSRFRTTVLPGTERDVLHVLTPDFMAELLDQKAIANVELQTDNLWIIRAEEVITKQALQNMFGMADVMLKNIAELSVAWQASSSEEAIDAMAATAVMPRVKLLSKRWRSASIVTVILVLMYVLLTILSYT